MRQPIYAVLFVLAACSGSASHEQESALSSTASCTANTSSYCACDDGTLRMTRCNADGIGYARCPCEQPPLGASTQGGTSAPPTAGVSAVPTGGVSGAATAGAGGMLSAMGGTSGTMAGAGGAGGAASSGGTGGSSAAGGSGGAAGTDGSDPYAEARDVCVDTINMYRATLSLPPLQRASTSQESCSDGGAKQDADSGDAHASAGQCPGLGAQNTCPGWGVGGDSSNATLADALKKCLAAMWSEGEPPVSRDACIADYQNCFLPHGHYLNMSDPNASVVACGFYEQPNGAFWMNQDFGS